ncbi:hypothetical protein EUX98_g7148 [Antrodiella citrinella]|uniref:Uncharacterized protein n=1 Tax=Antrodiella citrinella TaxID=2447956 RepID=A0A4V3XHY7_9APHY|nr:hypothetical protein EUX98_g7148 [Antrodiella citrinella]
MPHPLSRAPCNFKHNLAMSVRQRVPFKFSEEAVEDGVILDEQEQEELIQDLKKQSDVQNSQYLLLIQTVLALSGTLHLVYLFGPSKEPPTAAIFPRYLPPDEFNPIPGYHVFTLLHLFVHLNLSGQVLPTAHPLRRWFSRNVFTSSPYTFFIPLPYLFLFGIAALAPILSLFMAQWVARRRVVG